LGTGEDHEYGSYSTQHLGLFKAVHGWICKSLFKKILILASREIFDVLRYPRLGGFGFVDYVFFVISAFGCLSWMAV
jgi:hypothetical protein